MRNYMHHHLADGENLNMSKFRQKRSHISRPITSTTQRTAFDILQVSSRNFRRGEIRARLQSQVLEHGAINKHPIKRTINDLNPSKMHNPERAEAPKNQWKLEVAVGQFQNGQGITGKRQVGNFLSLYMLSVKSRSISDSLFYSELDPLLDVGHAIDMEPKSIDSTTSVELEKSVYNTSYVMMGLITCSKISTEV